MTLIKAAVCHEFGAPLTIEDIQIRAPEMGEVEVTLKAVAICHSDILLQMAVGADHCRPFTDMKPRAQSPLLAAGVNGVKTGDRVVVTLIRACGECPSCSGGKPTGCETAYDGDHGPIKTKDGGKLHQAMASGAFAERVVVDRSQVVVVP